MNKGITGHMMVKNEGRWVWFAIKSIIDYVDYLFVVDTGSTDKTKRCVDWFVQNPLYRHKIKFDCVGTVRSEDIHRIRQKMIDETTTEWFLIIDGDEIWFKNQMIELLKVVNSSTYKLIASRFINAVGDVFHRQDSSREKYKILNETGAITLRAFSKHIDGINCSGNYGVEGFFDSEGKQVQERKSEIAILSGYYLHTSYTARASTFWGDWLIRYRWKKVAANYDFIVEKLPKFFPEVFFESYPSFVRDPFQKDVFYGFMKKVWMFFKILRNKLRKFK